MVLVKKMIKNKKIRKLINRWSISGFIIGIILGILILVRQYFAYPSYYSWFNGLIEDLNIFHLTFLVPITMGLICGLLIFLLHLIFKKINFLKELKQSKKLMIIIFIVIFLIYIVFLLIAHFTCAVVPCGGEFCTPERPLYHPNLCFLTTIPFTILITPTLFPLVIIPLLFAFDYPSTYGYEVYIMFFIIFFVSALIWPFYIIFIKSIIKYFKTKRRIKR